MSSEAELAIADLTERVAALEQGMAGWLNTGADNAAAIEELRGTVEAMSAAIDHLAEQVGGGSAPDPEHQPNTGEELVSGDELVAPDFSFKFVMTGDVAGNITSGKVFVAGVATNIAPAALSGLSTTATHYFYITVDFAAGSATWGTGTSDPGNGDDDEEIIPILEIVVGASKITSWVQRQCGNIHITRAA